MFGQVINRVSNVWSGHKSEIGLKLVNVLFFLGNLTQVNLSLMCPPPVPDSGTVVKGMRGLVQK